MRAPTVLYKARFRLLEEPELKMKRPSLASRLLQAVGSRSESYCGPQDGARARVQKKVRVPVESAPGSALVSSEYKRLS